MAGVSRAVGVDLRCEMGSRTKYHNIPGPTAGWSKRRYPCGKGDRNGRELFAWRRFAVVEKNGSGVVDFRRRRRLARLLKRRNKRREGRSGDGAGL